MTTTFTATTAKATLVAAFVFAAAIAPAHAADATGAADTAAVTAVAPIAAAAMVDGVSATLARPVFGAPTVTVNQPTATRLAAIQPVTVSAADLREPKRPSALMPLYASFVALQIMDVHSTFKGLQAGAQEGNGLVQGVAGSPVKFLLVKAGAAAATIYMTEHIAKRNRVAAVLLMVGLNSAYATIAANNYHLANAGR